MHETGRPNYTFLAMSTARRFSSDGSPLRVAAAVSYAPQPSKCACLDTPYLPTIAGVEELVNSQANCIFGPDDGAPWCETSKDHKGWVYCYEVSEEQDAKARSGNVNGYGVTNEWQYQGQSMCPDAPLWAMHPKDGPAFRSP